MQIVPLYRYQRADGGVTTSPVMPEGTEYTMKYRIIADEGKAVTDGTVTAACVDADSLEGWTEIDAPAEDEADEDAQYAEAGRILMGVSE